MSNMGKWIEDVQSALADFDRPGRTLAAAFQSPGASPEDIGAAIRAVFGTPAPGMRPGDVQETADRLSGKLQGIALGLKDGLPAAILVFERKIVARLRGKPDEQRRAGLVLACEFQRFGRSPHGHVLVDPAGTCWHDLITPGELFQSGGSWLALGWPRGDGVRPFYRVEDVLRYTRQLEQDRRAVQFEHDQEQRRRDEAARLAWERSDAGRIRSLEAELAALKARQPAA